MSQFRTQLGHPAKIVHNDVSSVSLEREKWDTAGLQARSLFSLSCIETVCRCASQSLETNERKDRFYDLRYIFSGRVPRSVSRPSKPPFHFQKQHSKRKQNRKEKYIARAFSVAAFNSELLSCQFAVPAVTGLSASMALCPVRFF